MYKSKRKSIRIFRCIKKIFRWIIRTIYMVILACMIGLSNAYLNESRMIGDIRNFIQYEQTIDDEDTNDDEE